jgi:outer membrane biogenesis lipoprotein LolB
MVAAALLTACATPRAPSPADPSLEAWSGRFSADWVEATTPPRQDRASGRFLLERSEGRTRLEVSSPFGQTIARAEVSPDRSTIETADGRRHEASSPDALTESVLGWKVPVARLPDWLSQRDGTPTPDDWRVAVERDASGTRRLTLEWPRDRAGPEAPGVRIRLIVDPPSPAPTDGS